jgi:DNA-binding transcriptional LysR family regulator
VINYRHIEAFRAVMRTGGMTLAAQILHVTQPAVSRLVREFELDIGMPLFHRSGNRVTATAEAKRLLAEVERSYVGLRRISSVANALRKGETGSLTIVAMPAMAIGFLPRFVAAFIKERPGLDVSVEGHGSLRVREKVAGGEAQIGLSAVPFQHSSLEATVVDDPAVAVLPVGHRLAAKRSIRAQDFTDETLILIATGRFGGHTIEGALQKARPRNVIYTQHSSIACALTAEGAGISVVDPFSASEFNGRGVVVRPFLPTISLGFAVIHSKDRSLSLIADQFRSAFLQHVQGFLQRQDYFRSPAL